MSRRRITPGTLTMVIGFADTLGHAIGGWADTVSQLVAIRIQAHCADAVPRGTGDHTVSNPAERGDPDAVVLENVWFRYAPHEPWVLKDYCLRVARGEKLHLEGASGTGKTTVLRLIAGLLRPERGSVRVFGDDPACAAPRIAYLPQQIYLFEVRRCGASRRSWPRAMRIIVLH